MWKPKPRTSDSAENQRSASSERPIRREAQRAVQPFGGVAVFVCFLGRIDLVGKLRRHTPIPWKPANPIDPASPFRAFLKTVLAGAKRVPHAALLRGGLDATVFERRGPQTPAQSDPTEVPTGEKNDRSTSEFRRQARAAARGNQKIELAAVKDTDR